MRRYKMIVIDDEEISADGVSMLVEQSGLAVDMDGVFYSSIEALKYLKENSIDIVITDISMPELSGLEMIEKMKEANSRSLFIILTGYGSLEYAKEAMRYGVRHFLLKPCSPSELKESISECMGERDSQAQERFLRLKEVIKRQILNQNIKNEENNILTASFQMLMYEERYYECIHGDLETILYDREYGFSNIKGTMIYYVDNTISILPGLKKIAKRHSRERIVIYYCDSGRELTVEEIFKQGRSMFAYGFYTDESCVIEAGKVGEEKELQNFQLELPFRKVTKLLEKNDFSEARDQFGKILKVCRERKVPPQRLLELTEKFCREWMKNFGEEAIQAGIVKEILTVSNSEKLKDVLDKVIQVLGQYKVGELADGKISENLNLIIERYYNISELSLKWISQNLLYLNPEYMGKVYQKETSQKFTSKLLEIRMKKAEEFIRDERRVSEVASLVGFENNPDYFGTQFKKVYGLTPSQYGKRLKMNKKNN
ncbi:response regulator [Blautia liquoris]|uniref:Stage 0 sporulation protein A homolog n=1 Tax=Blautia liquoris TaxID=2779518 RepID=A0A7M2RIJ9_9FIRM|nr:response regulator [Blautia liquoris]QOV19182.1 response regulator [Blautia liquoris]